MKFYTQSGCLTAYGLRCGYIECNTDKGNPISITLREEHGVLHVQGHNHDEGKRLFWECFSSLKAARKEFKKRLKEYGQKWEKPALHDRMRDLELNRKEPIV